MWGDGSVRPNMKGTIGGDKQINSHLWMKVRRIQASYIEIVFSSIYRYLHHQNG